MTALSNPNFVEWLSTLAISFGAALLIAGFVSIVSGRILKLAPEHCIWIFIVGFAFLSSLATISITPADSWAADFLAIMAPLLLVFIYFLPSSAAVAARHPAFQGVFILNLLFGWTIIGWILAISWTLRRPQRPAAAYRFTPFGAIAETDSANSPSKSA
jgi:hypothetical protein